MKTSCSFSLLVGILLFDIMTISQSKFVGFTIDDESCSGLGNKTQQEIVCQQYFDMLTNYSIFISSLPYKYDPPLILSVDAGTGWTCTSSQSNCFNITYNNNTKSVAEHVVDLSNQTILMDYDQSYQKAITRAKPYLDYAELQYPNKYIIIGLAITDYNQQALWWQTSSEKQLEILMNNLTTSIKPNYKCFDGFAVFTGETFWNNSIQNPYITDNSNIYSTYLWYLDLRIVYNNTFQSDWFLWANKQKIIGIYTAPHHGNRPYIGGNSNDEKLFCDFLQIADKNGIDVQFFTSIQDAQTQDIPFVNNCFGYNVSS